MSSLERIYNATGPFSLQPSLMFLNPGHRMHVHCTVQGATRVYINICTIVRVSIKGTKEW